MSVLSGCFWPEPGQGPSRQAHNGLEEAISHDTVADLEQVWEAQLDRGEAGDPITSLTGVHVGDLKHVYGFNAKTGARQWRWTVDDVAGYEVELVMARGDEVLVGSIDTQWLSGWTTTVDSKTGDVLSQLDNARLLALRDSTGVFFTLVPGPRPGMQWPYIYFRDINSGEELGRHGAFLASAPAETVTLGRGNWFFVTTQGDDISPLRDQLMAISLGPPNGWALSLLAGPVVLSDDGATAYVVGRDQTPTGSPAQLHAIDAATGTILWRPTPGSEGGVAFEPNTDVSTPPALANGRLYVPTTSGEVAVINADGCGVDTCEPSELIPSGPVSQQPAIANDVMFVGTADGWVRAFSAEGCGSGACEALWEANTGSEITGAPAVSNGQLYVGTADGRLIAYGLPD